MKRGVNIYTQNRMTNNTIQPIISTVILSSSTMTLQHLQLKHIIYSLKCRIFVWHHMDIKSEHLAHRQPLKFFLNTQNYCKKQEWLCSCTEKSSSSNMFIFAWYSRSKIKTCSSESSKYQPKINWIHPLIPQIIQLWMSKHLCKLNSPTHSPDNTTVDVSASLGLSPIAHL